MTEKWIRHIEVRLPTRTFYGDEIDIEFSVKAGGQEAAATAEVTVWNLGPATRALFEKDTPIQVIAGYQDDYGGIFLGKIDTVHQTRDGADTGTVVTALDALQELRDAQRITILLPAGGRHVQAVREACRLVGIAPGTIEDPGTTAEQEITLYGTPAAVLQEVANRVNGALSRDDPDIGWRKPYSPLGPLDPWIVTIANNMLHFAPRSRPAGTAVLVSSATGLQEIQPKTDEGGEADYKVMTLLEHRIALDSTIVIEGRTVAGNYRVVKLDHSGSSDGGDYTTSIEVKAL